VGRFNSQSMHYYDNKQYDNPMSLRYLVIPITTQITMIYFTVRRYFSTQGSEYKFIRIPTYTFQSDVICTYFPHTNIL